MLSKPHTARPASCNAKITLVLLIGTLAFIPPADAGTKFKLLYSFNGGTDGANPQTRLIADKAGDLYGSTAAGGIRNVGVVFKLAPDGTESILHSFRGKTDGSYPSAVNLDTKGNLYGTTFVGGVNNGGTVFKISPTGKLSTLYAFTFGADGGNPSPAARLLLDQSLNLYGVTIGGGTGSGTVFKLAPDGEETVLLSLLPRKNGDGPQGGLLTDSTGDLYGTAAHGSGDGDAHDNGAIFKIAADGTASSVYTFMGAKKNDGAHPYAGVIMDQAGNLYGTTRDGGSESCDCGTIYKVDPDDAETPLHIFSGGSDGANPYGELVEDAEGNLYGTANAGGDETCGCGTVFKIAPDGTKTTLHTFTLQTTDGAFTQAGLIMDKNGNLYGTTTGGGAHGLGTVFEIHH